MKIGIIGSRTFDDYDMLKDIILKIFDIKEISTIVSGGAIGADFQGERFASEFGLNTQIFYPNWKKYGKRAGFERNTDIITNSDFVFVFWNGESFGTKHSIMLCHKHKISHLVVFFKDKVVKNNFLEGVFEDESKKQNN